MACEGEVDGSHRAAARRGGDRVLPGQLEGRAFQRVGDLRVVLERSGVDVVRNRGIGAIPVVFVQRIRRRRERERE